ncbi:MAG: hypothetical protein N2504_06470 [candidate division WOR-3 bacterium]|nr:hypothetical protein [candidate division WOR-3 bacterium]MCX7948213.1 hypothetical protein [candidate division WOR-3 bacterium]MDW8150015.1 hypothetical protein [candidate division WOR-3 bacterium]
MKIVLDTSVLTNPYSYRNVANTIEEAVLWIIDKLKKNLKYRYI